MEEKKGIKISLSTLLLFFAIIVIITMFSYIYLDKVNSNKEIAELEADNKDNSSSLNAYLEITKELNENELFKITKAIDNNDGTFTLMGKLYRPYIISESELNEILNTGTLSI